MWSEVTINKYMLCIYIDLLQINSCTSAMTQVDISSQLIVLG